MPGRRERWVRVSVRFNKDPKIKPLSLGGRALYLAGLFYCAENRTNGFIPRAALRLLAEDAAISERHARNLIPLLVKAELWDLGEGPGGSPGWVIHSFAVWQEMSSGRKGNGTVTEMSSADSEMSSAANGADQQVVENSRGRAIEADKDIAKGLAEGSMPRAREASRRQDQPKLSTASPSGLALVVDNDERSDMMLSQFGHFPTRSIDGIPLATLVLKFAADQSITYPPAESRTDVYRAVLDIGTQELPRPSTIWDTFAVNILADYLHDITGDRVTVSGRRMLQRATAQFGADRVLGGLTVAATSSAGLDDKHAHDELAVLKYATAVLRGENKRRAL